MVLQKNAVFCRFFWKKCKKSRFFADFWKTCKIFEKICKIGGKLQIFIFSVARICKKD